MIVLNDQGGAVMSVTEDIVATLRAEASSSHAPIILENHANDSRVTISKGVCPTLSTRMGTGGEQRAISLGENG